MNSIMQRLHDSEINSGIQSFFDGDWTAWLGDKSNGKMVAQYSFESFKDAEVLDEIPSAYKSIDEVMANQSDLVSIERELKAILCVKG